MQDSFAFLRSSRFWAIVIAAVALALHTDHIIDDAWFTAIGTITAGFTVIRTVDRMSDKKVEAAKIAAGKKK